MKKNKKGSVAQATFQTPVLTPREENHLMQELREAQRKYQEQIEINQEKQRKLDNQAEAILQRNKLNVRVRALEKDLQLSNLEHENYIRTLIEQHKEEIEQIMKEGRHQQVQEGVKVLEEKLAEKEGIIQFGKELLRKKDMEKEALTTQMNTLVEKGRQKINQFVGNLLKEKNNLLEFSRQQVTIVATKQAHVEELEKSKQALQSQVDALFTKSNSINQKLYWAEQIIAEQDALLDERREEIQKLVEEKKALTMHLQTSIQKEQQLKQFQKNISTLEHSLSVQKQMVSEGKNKAQALEKNLKVEQDKVQVLTTDLATHKMTSEAVIEKLEKSKQALQSQVDALFTKSNSINQKLYWAEQIIAEQDALLDERREEIQKLVEEKKALTMHLQTSIQKEQQLKQFQKNISTLEHSLSVQKQMVSEGKNKAQALEKNLKVEQDKVQVLTTDLATHKMTSEAVIEKLEKSKQALQYQVDTLHTKCNSINQKLDRAEQTIAEQDALLDERREEIQTLVEEKKALTMHLQTSIQKEQELKQFQKNISTLEHSLSVQKQMVSEGKNKAQALEKNLKVEQDKVQVLTTDLATHKMTSEAVIEKCSTVYQTVVQENKNHRDKIEELTVALNSTSEEKTTALLRCAALETSQKVSEDQLWQATIRIEELQAALDQKKKKKRRWFRFCN